MSPGLCTLSHLTVITRATDIEDLVAVTRVCLQRPALIRVPELDRLVLACCHAVVAVYTISEDTSIVIMFDCAALLT